MGRRLIVLLGLGAAAAYVRRRTAEPTAASAPPAPAPPAPAPVTTPTPTAAAVAATNGHAGSTNGHTLVEDDEAAADDDAPYGPGSAAPTEDGSAPEGFEIKAKTSSGLYHTTASPSFKRTRADVWFRSPEDAERAGFTAWNANRKR